MSEGELIPSEIAKKRILVVDDQTDFALLRRAMPEYEVQTESDPHKALAVAKRTPPDLMLLDLVMPEIHGLALARAFRRDRGLKHVPIIFVSALVHSIGEDEGPVLIGEYPAFGKPFRIEALKQCIAQQLEGDASAISGLRRVKIGTIAGW